MNVAIYKDGKYQKAKLVNGHLEECRDYSHKFLEFLDVLTSLDYDIRLTQEILDSFNIPNLGYIKTNTGFQVFDVSKEEYTEELLPLFVDVMGDIKETKKWIPVKTPTEESVNASREIYEKVKAEIIKLSQKETVETLRALLKEGNGIAYIDKVRMSFFDFLDILRAEGIKELFTFKGSVIIGTVATKPEIDLYVPKHLVPVVIGRSGAMIKQIAKEIHARRINVKVRER